MEVSQEPVLLEEGEADRGVGEEGHVSRHDRSLLGKKVVNIEGGRWGEEMVCCVSVRWCVCVCEGDV